MPHNHFCANNDIEQWGRCSCALKLRDDLEGYIFLTSRRPPHKELNEPCSRRDLHGTVVREAALLYGVQIILKVENGRPAEEILIGLI